MIQFTVPGQPVSQNRCYQRARQGRMFMTKEGKAWKAKVALFAKVAMPDRVPLEGPVSVEMAFYFPTRRNDLDGPIKPTLDALQDGRVFLNDRQVVRLVVTKHLDPDNPRAEIAVCLALHEAPTTCSDKSA